jgi:hypothetical protein
MGISFWDVMQVVAPVAATAIGGPVAGIAVSGAMGAGGSLAQGEDWRTALLKGGVGAGTGALAAGATGGLSKAATNVGAKAAERGMAQMAAESVAGGLGTGLPQFSQAALDSATKGLAKKAAFDSVGGALSKSLGKDEKVTNAMLKTTTGGANTLSQIASLYQPEDPSRFSDMMAALQGPGMSPQYQYGTSRRRTPTIGTGRFY